MEMENSKSNFGSLVVCVVVIVALFIGLAIQVALHCEKTDAINKCVKDNTELTTKVNSLVQAMCAHDEEVVDNNFRVSVICANSLNDANSWSNWERISAEQLRYVYVISSEKTCLRCGRKEPYQVEIDSDAGKWITTHCSGAWRLIGNSKFLH